MNTKRVWRHFILIILFAVFLGFTTNPKPLPEMETEIPVITSLWNWMQQSSVSLGLDLQGGTQLDYQIDMTDARARNADEDPDNDVDLNALLDGVKDVIERRVNSLGVSEPSIYLSSAGEEQHIIVELPGVKDIDEAKDKVGKVVQLEFKTEKEDASDEELAAVEASAQTLFDRISAEESIDDLEEYLEDDAIENQLEYRSQEKAYKDELPAEFQDLVAEAELNVFLPEVIKAKEANYIYIQDQFVQPEGFNILRVTSRDKELRKTPVNAEDFSAVAEELGQTVSEDFLSESDIQPEKLQLEVSALEAGQISGVVKTDAGMYIVKMTNKLAADDSDEAEDQINTSHILFKTEQAEALKAEAALKEIPEDAAEEERTQLEEENAQIEKDNEAIKTENAEIEERNADLETRNADIKAKAEEVLAQVKETPENFEDLAKEHSEDTSAENGGNLGYSNPSGYVEPYRNAALALEKGAITDELVESQFGYHIIKLLDLKKTDEERYQIVTLQVCHEAAEGCDSETTVEEAQTQADELLRRVREEDVVSYERVWLNAIPEPWKNTELDGRYFKRADVVYDQITFRPYVSISFDDEGATLFEELTEQNVGKQMAIFVGGEFISAPRINERIAGGQAQITLGEANVERALKEANDLAQSLNAGSIPAPLKKPSELNIGASLGQESLNKSLYAGALGLILVAVFMILMYRMMGVLASISLIVYGLFLTFVIQSQISPLIAVSLAFGMWVIFAVTLFRSKVDGLGKAIFLIFSIAGVGFVYSVLANPIVMTLAGVAGLILSVGMAVDANILIFERIREEFADGKSFLTAVNDGFERAWSSILDSNVSSLITCAILFGLGTSIMKGFAINLAAGIVISMFTAIGVTKTFLILFEGSKLEKIKWIWKK
jgi:protein-export membrane protein SecD